MTMTPREEAYLHTRIDRARFYLEFGTGQSTLYAARAPSLEAIDSVESSKPWIDEHLLPEPTIANAVATGRLTFHVVDVGATGRFGHPASGRTRRNWPRYSRDVFNGARRHDLVLVDGRFRVACTLNAVLHEHDNALILIHDFWNRPWYHAVLDFVDVVDRVDTMGAFRRKPAVDRKAAERLVEKYQYLPADGRPGLRHRLRALRDRFSA